MYATLSTEGILVPDGFALTAAAYRDALTAAKAWEPLHRLLGKFDKRRVDLLAKRAAEARSIVYRATGIEELRQQTIRAYRKLEADYGANVAVTVRSSATAEDLPSASFAGQHESFLNIRGADALFDACRRCFASIFTDRAISYRIDNSFDHFKVGLSVGVMKMVRADRAASGVMFTLDTESGFRDVVFVTGVYGLGENIVQGTVDPDEFYVHKPTFRAGYRAVLSRSLGSKQLRMVYAHGGGTTNLKVPKAQRRRFCVTDSEVLKLAADAIKIEDHYSSVAGHPMPMDIEWAKDATDGKLYIIQARPETVVSRRAATAALETYALGAGGKVLATGRAVGEKIASGPVRLIAGARELGNFKPGEVLVAESTTPDWEPVMKIAAAIVTERGGRTCHAAIVARELGIPAVVGADGAKKALKGGAVVTVSCAEGAVGRVYKGAQPVKTARLTLGELRRPKTAIMLNLGNPGLAFKAAELPNDGVGLARMEFNISESIKVHPAFLRDSCISLIQAAARQKLCRASRRTSRHRSAQSITLSERSRNVSAILGSSDLAGVVEDGRCALINNAWVVDTAAVTEKSSRVAASTGTTRFGTPSSSMRRRSMSPVAQPAGRMASTSPPKRLTTRATSLFIRHYPWSLSLGRQHVGAASS